MNDSVQMNVRISKELKSFAVKDAKLKFQSLSKYIEKLIYQEQQKNNELLKIRRCDMN